MTPAAYSLRAIVTDGVVTCPRWMHHLVKVMTSLAAFVALLVVGVPPVRAGWVAGPVLYVCVWIKEQLTPTDLAKYTLWEHVADTLTDAACACVALAAGYKLERGWTAGLVVFAACVLAWAIGHRDARP